MNISIAMATYNGEKYLAEQLDSILSQSQVPNEIIIVDDYSTDDTWQILQSYAKNNSTIKIYQNESNLGACQTFNKAILLTTGDLIALSDQDDVWLPNKLAVLMANISDNLLIHSDAYIVDEKLNVISQTFKKGVMSQQNFIDYLFANNVTGCTCLFKRELINLALPIPTGFYIHDHYLAIAASYFGKLNYLSIPLIKYRQHSNNQIGKNYQVSFDKFKEARQKVGSSLKLLANASFFSQTQTTIQLVAEYHLAIARCTWGNNYRLLDILQLKGGVKYFLSLLALTGFGNNKLAKLMYNWLKR
ncbi:MAG: glycosyltransferase family 2 protein [Neisseriales bacterium]|nr:MAG: glycosyltransferase family 2 protein [Neisseriales bacterium]